MQQPGFTLVHFSKFIRLKVSLAVTFAALASALTASSELSISLFAGIAGIFLLAAGASALNQVQEKDSDSRMERTAGRPLPAGTLTRTAAILIAVALLLAGLIILFLPEDKNAFYLGLFNILWYNGLYTFMKRKTAFAVVPGSLTGAIPVLMGWSVAGGSLLMAEPWLLAFFMFMWQIPHFWLLMLRYGHQYQMAGLPSLPDLFGKNQMRNIIFSWILAASMASLMLIAFGLWHNFFLRILIIVMNLILVFYTTAELFIFRKNTRHLFILINVFMMLVFILLILDQFLVPSIIKF